MKNFFYFIISFFKEDRFTGLIDDSRSISEREKDYLHEERASAPVTHSAFLEKKPENFSYPVENQNYTSSCVPHAVTLALGIELEKISGSFVRLSKSFSYRLRSNFPSVGASLQEMMQLHKRIGACLYDSLPTPFNERQMNSLSVTQAMFKEAENYKGLEYYQFEKPNDIDEIANVVATGKAVPLLIYATYKEWAREYPVNNEKVFPSTAPIRHCVCVLPNSAFIENGKRYVTIQDSSWFGGVKIRYVSEDFIKERAFGAGYFHKAKIVETQKPVHTFFQTLKLGMQSAEVRWLQKVLVYEGLLPEDCTTGYFGGRTLAAVKEFQKKHAYKILVPLNLTQATGLVGPSTNSVLNEIYSH